jgi:hypothetical protein
MIVSPGGVSLRFIDKESIDFVEKKDYLIVEQFQLGPQRRFANTLVIIVIRSFLSYFANHINADERIMHISIGFAIRHDDFDEK